MKKLLLLLTFIISCSLASKAQWTSGGTQLTFTPTQDMETHLSPSSQGGYYITFRQDTFPSANGGYDYIMLNAYDSASVVKPGWNVGGIRISQAGVYYSPQLITSEDDNVIVSWYGNDTSILSQTQNIYVQKYSSAGLPMWNGGTPVQLNNDNAHLDKRPFIISDKNKGAFIAWTRYNKNINFDSLDIYLQHIDSTGNVASGWNTNGLKAAGNPYREQYPLIALTKDMSSIYMAYAAHPDSVHLLLNKFNTSDGSEANGWTSAGVPVTLPRSNIYPNERRDFWLFVDSIGNATVLWVEARTTGNGELYMNQVSTTGVKKLGLSGKYLIGNNAVEYAGILYVDASQDKDDNLLITCNDYNIPNGWSAVDALKVNPNGTIYWSKLAVTGNDYSEYPKAVTDGKRGMYIFYEDSATLKYPFSLKAYALDSTGKIYSGWKADGSYFGNGIDPDGTNPNLDFSVIPSANRKGIISWLKRDAQLNFYVFSCNLWSTGSVCSNNPLIFTGIEEVELNGVNCIIYPNPAGDYAIVKMNENLANKNDISLSLFDLSGKEVIKYQLNSTAENNINTSQLAQGMYFYHLSANNEVIQNGKLIKE